MSAGAPVIDTTGAGDAFAAALVAALARRPMASLLGGARGPRMTAASEAGLGRCRRGRRPGTGRRRARAASPVVTVAALLVSDEVRAALAAGRPVVALESSLIAQGLPAPHNLETALAAEAAVREAGAVPATTALEDGRLVVGADRELLERLADPDREVAKAGSRDLGPLLAGRRSGVDHGERDACALAHLAGIAMFATGGIGGVHRGASRELRRLERHRRAGGRPRSRSSRPGAKSILDLPATLELLETRRVPVIGYGVDELPGFYSVGSGLARRRTGSTDRRRRRPRSPPTASLPGAGGLLIVQPPPAELALDAAEVEALDRGRRCATRRPRAFAAAPSRRTSSAFSRVPRAAERWPSTSA